jgi:DNA invertase Pin-like site-specific DNA recombinase
MKEFTISSSPDFSPERASQSKQTPQLFPMILQQMLEGSEREKQDHIVGWSPNRLSFKIHELEEYVKTLLQKPD